MSEFYVPDGARDNLPLVRVREESVEELGLVKVEYDGLEEMFRRDLHVPVSHRPVVELTDRTSGAAGKCGIISKDVKVNPQKARDYFGKDGLAQVLLHEGTHLADLLDDPVKWYGFLALTRGVVLGSAYFAGKYGYDASTTDHILAAGIIGAAEFSVANSFIYKHSPFENRARQSQTNEDLIEKYRNVITFPGLSVPSRPVASLQV